MSALQGSSVLSRFGIASQWLGAPPSAPRRLLIVYAHPDDESFGNAGTIARYAAEGAAVHYVCATRGECGTLAPGSLDGYADVAALRSAELSCAAQALGMAAVHHLNYRDSGMPGSADNHHAAALMQAPEERVAGQITAVMRLVQPQVVVTFGPYGGYGHPDHIAVHRATVAALAAAGDPAAYAEHFAAGLAPWRPAALYYSTFGVRMLKLAVRLMRLARRDPRRVGQNNDVDLLRALAEATPITTSVACGPYEAQKERAWLCHRSQLGSMGGLMRLPRRLRRLFAGTEHFTRVEPVPDAMHGRGDDLFAGLALERGGSARA